ncbi:MAG: hypothetical protein BGO67_11940 [Alphaproteobacteria bacterium 41-28]|nr:MAG: hypothetical protein BGO67_11940 [Alphaproteobacteria bacterium 41-28]
MSLFLMKSFLFSCAFYITSRYDQYKEIVTTHHVVSSLARKGCFFKEKLTFSWPRISGGTKILGQEMLKFSFGKLSISYQG